MDALSAVTRAAAHADAPGTVAMWYGQESLSILHLIPCTIHTGTALYHSGWDRALKNPRAGRSATYSLIDPLTRHCTNAGENVRCRNCTICTTHEAAEHRAGEPGDGQMQTAVLCHAMQAEILRTSTKWSPQVEITASRFSTCGSVSSVPLPHLARHDSASSP